MQRPGGKFYDLGSGTGKPVIAAAILHNFDVCVGIEILEGLYSMSLDVAAAYNSKVINKFKFILRINNPILFNREKHGFHVISTQVV